MQREDLDRQTRPAFGSTAGQDFPAVFCAHAFAEPVFSLLLEVRRLLKRKRHTGHPFEQNAQANSIERRIIGRPPRPVKPAGGRAKIEALTVMLSRVRCPHSLVDTVNTFKLGRFCGPSTKNGLDCLRSCAWTCGLIAINTCGIRALRSGARKTFWHCLCEVM